MKHLLPELPYALDALAPAMSADTLNYHYGKHLQTYLDNVNRMIEGTPFADMKLKDMITKAQGALYNNAAQAFNHIIFIVIHFQLFNPTLQGFFHTQKFAMAFKQPFRVHHFAFLPYVCHRVLCIEITSDAPSDSIMCVSNCALWNMKFF